MYLQKKTYLLIILFSPVMSAANAQSAAADSTETVSDETPAKKPGSVKHLLNKLNDMYFNTKCDTNYVARPKEKWQLRFLGNQTGNYIHAKSTLHGVYSKYDLHTRTNYTVGLEVYYCDLAATLSKESGDSLITKRRPKLSSMQDSARRVRLSLGRPSSHATRQQALQQVAILKAAKEAQQTGNWIYSR